MGVGGAGGNAINRMIEAGVKGVEYIAVNTDNQDLYEKSKAAIKIHIGPTVCAGRGAGANPDVGEKAARESIEQIKDYFTGVDMLFITAGMGGGTGTGATPVIAQAAKEMGVLVVGIVSKPFHYEGRKKMETANRGVSELIKHVNTLITIPNQKLFDIARELSIKDAFREADDVLRQAVQGISDLITRTGFINLDFADVKTIMSIPGGALMGVGHGKGKNKEIDAAKEAIKFELLEEASIAGAKGVLINIRCDEKISIEQIEDMTQLITAEVSEDANIIHGTVIDDSLEDEIFVTVIGTGFDKTIYVKDQKPADSGALEQTAASSKAAVTVPPLLKTEVPMVQNMDPIRFTQKEAAPLASLQSLPMKMDREIRSIFGGPLASEYDVPAYLRKPVGSVMEKE